LYDDFRKGSRPPTVCDALVPGHQRNQGAIVESRRTQKPGSAVTCFTGDESYSKPFDSALQQQQSIRQTLRQLVAGDAAQQAALNTVDRWLTRSFWNSRRPWLCAGGEWTRRWPWFAPARASGSWTNAVPRYVPWKKGTGCCWRSGPQRPTLKTIRMRWVLELGSGSLVVLLVIAGAVIERDSRDRESARQDRDSERGAFSGLALDAARRRYLGNGTSRTTKCVVRGIVEMYGIEPHQPRPLVRDWRDIVHPDDRANAEEVVAQAARNGTELNVEFRVCVPGGTERWLMSEDARYEMAKADHGTLRRHRAGYHGAQALEEAMRAARSRI
jgi:hypothetical protein